MKIVVGDLFDSPDTAIGHGVNVDGLMGSGIALPMRQRFPQMYSEYQRLCFRKELHPGDIQIVKDQDRTNGVERVIVNLASQDRPGPAARYEWLTQSLDAALYHLSQLGIRNLSLPMIGCGIGGLNWAPTKEIIQLVERLYPTFEVKVYVLDDKLAKESTQ